jgi:protein kinase-like protein
LHCDISIGNVLLHRLDENKEAKGLLVDFDFAKAIEKDDDVLGGSSGDAGDASGSKAGNLKGLPVSSKSTGTKSARNDVWTVSGIYAYQTPSITLFLGNPPLCCHRSFTLVSKALQAETLP